MEESITPAVTQSPLVPKYKIFNSFTLKVAAVVTMLIDHAAMTLMSHNYASTDIYTALRAIGRLAMPIYCFMIVQGMLHTRNVFKYMMRLFICAVVSEIPFNLALNAGYGVSPGQYVIYDSEFFLTLARKMGSFSVILHPDSQNVLWTLLIGLFCIYIFETLRNSGKKIRYVLDPLLFVGMYVLADFLMTDYGGLGVLLIVSFYLCRNIKIGDVDISSAVALVVFNAIYFILSSSTGELYSLVAIAPLMLYNGKRGLSNNVVKYGFYAFYPVHLTLLYLISLLINR